MFMFLVNKNFCVALGCFALLAGCDSEENYIKQANIMSANIELVQKAHAGNLEATEQLLTCLENAIPYPTKNRDIYYWLIKNF